MTLLLESPRLQLFLLLFLAIPVFFANLWIGDLGLDSCAYATISRTILRTGDWLVPHYQHSREYADCWLHPPLFYWLTAISFSAFGPTEFGSRFVAALLGLGTILLVYGIGRAISGSPRVGFVSALVLLTTQPFLDLARKCQMDVPLAFFITLSVYFLVLRPPGRRPLWMDAAAGAAAGCALLTKGVPGFAVVLLALVHAWLDRDGKRPLPYRIGLYCISLLCVLAAWLVPLMLRGRLGDFVHHYFLGQIWSNLSGTGPAHQAGFLERLSGIGWYLRLLLESYWPWLPFLVLAVVLTGRSWKTRKSAVLFLAWFVIVLGGFAAGQARYPRYLAPLYPAASLLIGVVLAELLSTAAYRRVLGGTAALLVGVLLATSTAPLYFGRIHAADRSDIKALRPMIQQLCPVGETVDVFGLEHWDAMASFAFYVDRAIRDTGSEDQFARNLREREGVGYLEARVYDGLSESFRREFVPYCRSNRMLLIVSRKELEALRGVVFPLHVPSSTREE